MMMFCKYQYVPEHHRLLASQLYESPLRDDLAKHCRLVGLTTVGRHRDLNSIQLLTHLPRGQWFENHLV